MTTLLEQMKARVARRTAQQLQLALPDNPFAAKAVRDRAIEQAGQGAGVAWMTLALHAIRDVAHANETFTTDALWSRITQPREPRALGAAMQEAKRQGLCEPTNMTVCSRRVACHARPLRVWMSLVWNGSNG